MIVLIGRPHTRRCSHQPGAGVSHKRQLCSLPGETRLPDSSGKASACIPESSSAAAGYMDWHAACSSHSIPATRTPSIAQALQSRQHPPWQCTRLCHTFRDRRKHAGLVLRAGGVVAVWAGRQALPRRVRLPSCKIEPEQDLCAAWTGRRGGRCGARPSSAAGDGPRLTAAYRTLDTR